MAKKIKIDFTDTDSEIRKRKRATRVPEGEYVVKVNNFDGPKKTKSGDSKYIRWECTIVKPVEFKGKTLWGSTSLKKDALWSLRNLIFAALGKNVAGKVAAFDPDTLIGKVVGASVSDNEYEKDGTTIITSQIDSFFPKEEAELAEAGDDDSDDDEDEEDLEEDEEDEDEEDEEEKPKKKKKSSKKAKDEDDEEEEEDDELEDVDVEDI